MHISQGIVRLLFSSVFFSLVVIRRIRTIRESRLIQHLYIIQIKQLQTTASYISYIARSFNFIHLYLNIKYQHMQFIYVYMLVQYELHVGFSLYIGMYMFCGGGCALKLISFQPEEEIYSQGRQWRGKGSGNLNTRLTRSNTIYNDLQALLSLSLTFSSSTIYIPCFLNLNCTTVHSKYAYVYIIQYIIVLQCLYSAASVSPFAISISRRASDPA